MKRFFQKEIKEEYFKKILLFLQNNNHKVIYPQPNNIFKAFSFKGPHEIKVVIIGQDPYHGPNQANGLAFSVSPQIKNPPSLVNMYKELKSDLNIIRENGDLTSWAKQGVFLLNNTLSVFKAQPNSHKNIGWDIFTNNVIKYLDKEVKPIFVLWGGFAQKKSALIKTLKSLWHHTHPHYPLIGIFWFKTLFKINQFLKLENKKTINWK